MVAPTTETGRELAEAHMRGLLASLGLDVDYVRGEGDTLYYRKDDGTEVPVLDLVGGYGSLIFGHNHPRLVALARELLADQVAIHAQFSYHPYANELATALNRVIHREFGIDEPYSAIFANTGAEGIETAMKHAEMDRVMRLGELRARVDAAVTEAVAAVAVGSAVAPEVYRELGVDPDGEDAFDRAMTALAARNDAAFATTPVFFGLTGGFHGKLVSSVQLTHNPGYRLPFSALGCRAVFLPTDRPQDVASGVAAEAVSALVPVTVDGVVRLSQRPVPVIGGFFVEPIQGEGGIHVLPVQTAAAIRAAADAWDFPVIVDEVQSGMGRTGAFFASSSVGLLGDTIVLAKGIGGGIAKSAVVLLRGSRYRSEFELVHSSTFAKDAFSCHIGIEVVRMLEADGGAAYRAAAERGARLCAELQSVQAEFPEVISEVRGAGLMLGIEFADLTTSPDPILRDQAGAGLIGYVFAGYLLREHGIRVFPTASAAHTLRVEPSLGITHQQIGRFGAALRDLCELLRDSDGMGLLPRG